jgi:ketosteroid isomerase-like protein
MNALESVRSFVRAVNAADISALCGLMTEDHLFIDSDGTETRGREVMRRAWVCYFSMMRDYKIQVQETHSKGAVVVVIGAASGTYSPDGSLRAARYWRVPTAWRAVIRRGRVAVWQVFTNPEPVARLMGRRGKSAAQ